jgi:hypothetical protein
VEKVSEELKKIAEARCDEPMSSWPQHEDFHKRNTHPFSGSKYGERYWDESCLRCQLERAAAKKAEAAKS